MIQRLVLSLLFLLLSFGPLLLPSPLQAQTKAWDNIPVTAGRCLSPIDKDTATIQGLECLFYNVLQVISFVAGLVFFAMFIVGGFQYLMSSNEQKAVAQASSTLTMSVIGIVGVILSWFILRFIFNFTGLNVLNFIIPGSP